MSRWNEKWENLKIIQINYSLSNWNCCQMWIVNCKKAMKWKWSNKFNKRNIFYV